MGKIKIPVAGLDAQCAEVPDHVHLTMAQSGSDYLHGDGFWPIEKDKQAKATAGTGLIVQVADYFAMIDGHKLAYRGVKNLDFNQKVNVNVAAAVGAGTRYIVLKTGRDDHGCRESKEGTFVVTDQTPNAAGVIVISGEDTIPVCKLNIPGGTTQVTSGMIDNSVKKWMVDTDGLLNKVVNLEQQSGGTSARFEREMLVNLADTNFKIDAYHNAEVNDMYKGWIDILQTAGDIDPASDAYKFKSSERKIVPPSPTGGVTPIDWWQFDNNLVGEIAQNVPAHVNDTVGFGTGKFGTGLRINSIYPNGMPYPVGAIGLGTENAPLLYTPDDTAYTVTLWAKKDSSLLPYGEIMATQLFRSYSVTHDDWSAWFDLFWVPGQLSLNIWGWGGGGNWTAEMAEGLDTWVHFVFQYVKSENKVYVYVNKVLKITADLSEVGMTGLHGLWHGVEQAASRSIFFGTPEYYGSDASPSDVDNLGIYKVVLDADDISDNYDGVMAAGGTPPTFPLKVITKVHDIGAVPANAFIEVKGTDLTYRISRDGGTTWTAITNKTITDISGQPSGQNVKLELTMTAVTSEIDDIAVWGA